MTKKPRKGWTQYFLDLADVVSTRSTCDRKAVGCVLVRDNQAISSGYNGSAPKSPHCDDVGHDLVQTLREDGSTAPNCVRTTHAEANAVAQAARRGASTEGAIAYVNTFPCFGCFKLLASAGVRAIVFRDEYREDDRVREAARLANVVIVSEKHAAAWDGTTTHAPTLVPGYAYLYRGAWWTFSGTNEAGMAIVHPVGEPDMQSSIVVRPDELSTR